MGDKGDRAPVGHRCGGRRPNGEVVALTGDGGLMMCLHELHTFAAEGFDLT